MIGVKIHEPRRRHRHRRNGLAGSGAASPRPSQPRRARSFRFRRRDGFDISAGQHSLLGQHLHRSRPERAPGFSRASIISRKAPGNSPSTPSRFRGKDVLGRRERDGETIDRRESPPRLSPVGREGNHGERPGVYLGRGGYPAGEPSRPIPASASRRYRRFSGQARALVLRRKEQGGDARHRRFRREAPRKRAMGSGLRDAPHARPHFPFLLALPRPR